MLNRYTGSGRLTADPELRTIIGKDGQSVDVVRIRLAVDRMGRSGTTGFINIDEYGPGAKPVAEHLTKGSYAAVDGRLEWREWQDGDRKRDALSIVGHIDFGPKATANGPELEQSEEQGVAETAGVENDAEVAAPTALPSRETVSASARSASSPARTQVVAAVHPTAAAALSAAAAAGMGL